MDAKPQQSGMTRIELLLLLIMWAVIAWVVVVAVQRDIAYRRQNTCLRQVSMILVSLEMYVGNEDEGMPGHYWTATLNPYLPPKLKISEIPNASHRPRPPDQHFAEMMWKVPGSPILHCPNDAANGITEPVSYGYNARLLSEDGSGGHLGDCKSPRTTFVLCEAGPTQMYPYGGLIGATHKQLGSELVNVFPCTRHGQGIIVGYLDGHAECSTSFNAR